MSEYQGSALTVNILVFGIIAFCFVSLRTSFRLYTRKASTSDWLLVVALVRGVPPPASSRKKCRDL